MYASQAPVRKNKTIPAQGDTLSGGSSQVCE